MEKTTPMAVKTVSLREDMTHDGVTVLTYQIDYPEFQSAAYQLAVAAINRYYQMKALEIRRHVEEELYPAAVEQAEQAAEDGFPTMVYQVLTTYRVTYNDGCILSLYEERYEFTGGAHGSTVRESQTWNLQKCSRIRLRDLFGCAEPCKEVILREVRRQIAQNPALYFENADALAAETLNEDSFYCTPQGIVVYYQQYDIAPYSSGIREFLLPYGGCVYEPRRTCFNVK